MTSLVLYFSLAIAVSFLCSLLEAVLLSISPAYIAVKIKYKHKSGKILQNFKKRVDRPLAAILTLNTVSNTVGAAGVGAQTLKVYGNEYLALASGALTISILIVSEIIPKTLGANYWKRLAPFAAYAIQVLIWITYPFVALSMRISQLLSKTKENNLTREEMIMTAELGANEGTIKTKESRIISNLLMLDNIFVGDIMTPRSVLLAFEENQTVKDVLKKHRPLRYSRIPVYAGNLDKIVGLVHRYKLLEASSADYHDMKVRNVSAPIDSVPESLTVAAVLDQFVQKKGHLFLVLNAQGKPTGIVTLEDAIETLLGVEIMDEFDSVADLRAYALDLMRKKKGKVKGKPS